MEDRRRRFTKEFKISVLRELKEGKTAAQVSREHALHPAMVRKWKQEYGDNPETAFGGKGKASSSEAKVAERERLIGQLYTENAFLKKALSALEERLADLRKR